MAWIELHQALIAHPKIKRLARRLGVQVPAAIGHVVCLWCWCLEYAQDGGLEEFEVEEIADAAMYTGDAMEFIEAMIDSGFLDQRETLTVHDWHDYAGRLIERRAANTQRMKNARAQHVRSTCATRADADKRTCEATVPYRTVHDHVHVGSPAAADDACTPEVPAVEEASKASTDRPPSRTTKSRDTYPAEFDEFWKPYPRKVVKDAAAESYRRARAKGATAEEIKDGLARWLGSVDWRDQEASYLPHASTWLNQRRWLDEPEQVSKAAVIPLDAGGRPDDLAWERSFVKAYDTDQERIEALIARARAVQRVAVDPDEAQAVLAARGLDEAMRWVRDAVRAGPAGER